MLCTTCALGHGIRKTMPYPHPFYGYVIVQATLCFFCYLIFFVIIITKKNKVYFCEIAERTGYGALGTPYGNHTPIVLCTHKNSSVQRFIRWSMWFRMENNDFHWSRPNPFRRKNKKIATECMNVTMLLVSSVVSKHFYFGTVVLCLKS